MDEAVAACLPCTCGCRRRVRLLERAPGGVEGETGQIRRFGVDTYRASGGGVWEGGAVDLSKTRIWRRTRWLAQPRRGLTSSWSATPRAFSASAVREHKRLRAAVAAPPEVDAPLTRFRPQG